MLAILYPSRDLLELGRPSVSFSSSCPLLRYILYIMSSTACPFSFRDLASKELNRGTIVEIALHFGSAACNARLRTS